MKRSQQRILTGSTLLVVAALFLAALVLSGLLLRGIRVDLTENRLYTLTDGTLSLIGKIEEPVNLYFFFSDSAASNLPPLRSYATRVRELLEEIAARSKGKVRLEVIDPQPFTEAEDRAAGFGLRSLPSGPSGESLFFGLAGTNAVDGQTIIPFFPPDKEAFLEYDIAKLISSLSQPKRPVAGILSSLRTGPGFDQNTGGPTEGWVVDGELNELFDLRRLVSPLSRIDDEIDLLILIHPKNLPDDTLYAIDQFAMRGGRLLVFVDPHSEIDSPATTLDVEALASTRSSNLDKLFESWGIVYDPTSVVLDAKLALPVQTSPEQAPVRHPAILGLGKDELNQDDVVSADVAVLNMASVGHLSLSEDAPLRMEPLAQSSTSAKTDNADIVGLTVDPSGLLRGFVPTGQAYVLAARLRGEAVPSAFPERAGEGHLSSSVGEVNMIVVADTDILTDRLWVQVQQFFGERVAKPFANNGDFAINAADNLVGSSDLIRVRTRALAARPFRTVEALRRQADERFRAKEGELQAELAATQRRIDDLQVQADERGRIQLTPELQVELDRFEGEKLRIRGELRQVRANLDSDIQALGARLKLINIVLVPLLVSLAAAAFAIWRARRRRRALAI